jgi:hypothetical protein
MLHAELKSKLILDNILQDAAAELSASYLKCTGLPPKEDNVQTIYWTIVKELRSSGIHKEIRGPEEIDLFKRTARICSGIVPFNSNSWLISKNKIGVHNGVNYFLELYKSMKQSYDKDKEFLFEADSTNEIPIR